jgi:hypothetical protein
LAVSCRERRFGGSAATSVLAGISIFNLFGLSSGTRQFVNGKLQGMMLRALHLEFDNARPLGCGKFWDLAKIDL